MNESEIKLEKTLIELERHQIAADDISDALATRTEEELDRWFYNNQGRKYSMSGANALRAHRLRLREQPQPRGADTEDAG